MNAQTQQIFSHPIITTHAVPHNNAPYEVSTLQGTAQVTSLGKLFFFESSNHPSTPSLSAYYRLSILSVRLGYSLAL